MLLTPESVMRLPKLAQIDRELVARRGFREFARLAWPHTGEVSALRWGWHHDAMCEHLEALYRLQIRDLVINVPPGTSKSSFCSVMFPAWVWTQEPSHRFIAASYSSSVSLRDARKNRALVRSDWFCERWPEAQLLPVSEGGAAVGEFYTTAGGMRFSTTVRGAVTGNHGDSQLTDDPHDPAGVSSVAELERDHEWWTETMPSRARDLATLRRLLVMQRLHERDLSAAMYAEGATVLCLPMRFEKAHPYRHPRDPRTEEGQLLQPDRFPEVEVAKLERRLGPFATAGQLQQRPAPRGGALFKETYFTRWYDEVPTDATYTISCDFAFKGKEDSDFVAMQVWAQKGADFYLVDESCARLGFSDSLATFVALCARYPQAIGKLIEDKANGTAVMDTLKAHIVGLIPVEPDGGKVARAHAVEPLWAAGNVHLPRVEKAPWVTSFIAEHLSFPRGANDDRVDAATQYLVHASRDSFAIFEQAMMTAMKG